MFRHGTYPAISSIKVYDTWPGKLRLVPVSSLDLSAFAPPPDIPARPRGLLAAFIDLMLAIFKRRTWYYLDCFCCFHYRPWFRLSPMLLANAIFGLSHDWAGSFAWRSKPSITCAGWRQYVLAADIKLSVWHRGDGCMTFLRHDHGPRWHEGLGPCWQFLASSFPSSNHFSART
jgi:hypothetical protein